MLIKKPADIPSSQITDERLYFRRREFMQIGAGLVGAAAGGLLAACGRDAVDAAMTPTEAAPRNAAVGDQSRMVTVSDPPNTFEQITSYNNYYEFGTDKRDPVNAPAS
jgi:sulfoxide reductase catalytic subunit YedY